VSLGYSRANEYEADAKGLNYMTAAGYNPYALPSLMGKLKAMEGRSPTKLEEFFSTHPATTKRLDEINKIIAANYPAAKPITAGTAVATIKALWQKPAVKWPVIGLGAVITGYAAYRIFRKYKVSSMKYKRNPQVAEEEIKIGGMNWMIGGLIYNENIEKKLSKNLRDNLWGFYDLALHHPSHPALEEDYPKLLKEGLSYINRAKKELGIKTNQQLIDLIEKEYGIIKGNPPIPKELEKGKIYNIRGTHTVRHGDRFGEIEDIGTEQIRATSPIDALLELTERIEPSGGAVEWTIKSKKEDTLYTLIYYGGWGNPPHATVEINSVPLSNLGRKHRVEFYGSRINSGSRWEEIIEIPYPKALSKHMIVPESMREGVPPVPSAIPKELEPLATEARKYKSAEEFLYRINIAKRGSANLRFSKLSNRVVDPYNFGEPLSGKGDILSTQSVDRATIDKWKKIITEKITSKKLNELPIVVIEKNAQGKWIITDGHNRAEAYKEVGFDVPIVTKSQITDFYAQATGNKTSNFQPLTSNSVITNPIPEFRSTNDALAYGRSVAGKPEKINELLISKNQITDMVNRIKYEPEVDWKVYARLTAQLSFINEALAAVKSNPGLAKKLLTAAVLIPGIPPL